MYRKLVVLDIRSKSLGENNCFLTVNWYFKNIPVGFAAIWIPKKS